MLFSRSTIAAAILAVALAFTPQASSAKTNVHVGIGIGGWGWGGGWGHNCLNGWAGRCGYPRNYYRPHTIYYGGHYGYGNGYYGGYAYRPAVRVGCGQAMAIVRHNGYVRVSTASCGGRYHAFNARRNGHSYFLKVNSWNGRVVVVSRS